MLAEADRNEQEPTMKTVKVTNRAGRWVCVRIGNGRTLRLGPRETSAELPAHYSRAAELQALCAKGVLTVLDTEPTSAPSSSKPEESHVENSGSDGEETNSSHPEDKEAS